MKARQDLRAEQAHRTLHLRRWKLSDVHVQQQITDARVLEGGDLLCDPLRRPGHEGVFDDLRRREWGAGLARRQATGVIQTPRLIEMVTVPSEGHGGNVQRFVVAVRHGEPPLRPRGLQGLLHRGDRKPLRQHRLPVALQAVAECLERLHPEEDGPPDLGHLHQGVFPDAGPHQRRMRLLVGAGPQAREGDLPVASIMPDIIRGPGFDQ